MKKVKKLVLQKDSASVQWSETLPVAKFKTGHQRNIIFIKNYRE